MVIERKNEHRSQLTAIGEISYQRTYCYPVDEIAGREPYQRISNSMADNPANAAIDMSYAKAGKYTVEGMVSKQAVMSCIRKSEPCKKSTEPRRHIPVLHIDVDEAHVAMQYGKKVIVPSFTVYAGIDVKGKRHSCINAFGISEFGMDSDTIWEKVVNEVDRRYDIEDTLINIHGDCAEWIKNGKFWFANSVYVLDSYHRNFT